MIDIFRSSALRAGLTTVAILVATLPAEAVIVGTQAARFDDTLRGGGVIAQGASLAGRADAVVNASAAITIAGIPAGATVQRALLYWVISGGTDTTATLNGTAVSGTTVATAGQTCWGVNNTTYRADVTALVTGNGTYTIAGLPSSTVAASADTDGAALVVVYQNLSSGLRRRVMIRDGGISTSGSGEVVSDTFTGVAAPVSSTGFFHLVVGDGESFLDGALTFNGLTIGNDQFSGTDGSLWDVRTYGVAVISGLANAPWTHTTGNDCLLFAAAVFDFTVGICGDAVRTGGEPCDQGNLVNGDGCSSVCVIEPGWTCTSANPSVCTPICGDGLRVGSEGCDDGDVSGGDGCSATCTVESGWSCVGTAPSVCSPVCGDGIVTGTEQCDDGAVAAGDGCSATCTIEAGWLCLGSPSACSPICGDGIIVLGEGCDDGDMDDGDGCASVCQTEPGWSCAGAPSVCDTICGDTIVAGTEECDDGNVDNDDGCSDACTLEPCIAQPVPVCLEAAEAQLQSNEKTAGKEKLKLKWKKITTPTTQLGFGDPVAGTTLVAVCIYDDADVLVEGFAIDRAGELCGTQACWKKKSTKGYGYKDKAKTAEGIGKIGYQSGGATKGKADAGGANNAANGQLALPTGLAAALAGNSSPTIQLVTSDGMCIGATMNDVQTDTGTQYKASKR